MKHSDLRMRFESYLQLKVTNSDLEKKLEIIESEHVKQENKLNDAIVSAQDHYGEAKAKKIVYDNKYLSKKGLYIIEDFKFPNYFEYNRDVEDVLVDKLLENLSNKISNDIIFLLGTLE